MNVKKLVAIVFGFLISLGSLNVFATAGEVIDDTVITTSVKAKLLGDKHIASLQISVLTKNGVVHLSGHVKMEDEATAAIEIAASTPGVNDVDSSELKIDASNNSFEDAAITAKVKGVYLKEKLFGEKSLAVSGIHVSTKDGVVYLKGKVDTKEQLKLAQDLAKSVNGAKKIESTLTVN